MYREEESSEEISQIPLNIINSAMLGKRTRPVIGKLPDPTISGDRTGFPDLITSPKSPLDFKIRSPRGFKNSCVAGSGVGLGIVAALESSGTAEGQAQAAKFIVGNLNLNRSEPIPIGSAKSCLKNRIDCSGGNYPNNNNNNKSINRIFFDGEEFATAGGCPWRYSGGVSYGSPAMFEETTPAYPTSSFLSSCYLCRKTLHGRDIFMYRGEKAFCSVECRYKQIVSDERKEKCRSEASRSTADIAVSPYSGGQLFSTGIIAS